MFSKAKSHMANPLLPSLTMRDLAAVCFGEHTVSVAAGSDSSSGRQPMQNTISSFYRATLSTHKELLVKVTWHRNSSTGDTSVSVVVEDDHLSSSPFKPNGTNSQLLKKKKGSRSFVSGNAVFVLHWDTSSAKYGSGPEPAKDFYLLMLADSELILLLGDKCRDFIKKFEDKVPIAEFSIYSRREQVLGAAVYKTRARFRDGGKDHDVSIRCKGDERDAEGAELYICIDKKMLIHVKSIQWNFRGNQTIFIDGSPIDVLWDVHDWWFHESSSSATFMFQSRNTLDIPPLPWAEEELGKGGTSQFGPRSTFKTLLPLWAEEELGKGGTSQFTLLVQAFKSQ